MHRLRLDPTLPACRSGSDGICAERKKASICLIIDLFIMGLLGIWLKTQPWYLQLLFNLLKGKLKTSPLGHWKCVFVRFQSCAKGPVIRIQLSFDEWPFAFVNRWFFASLVEAFARPDISIKLNLLSVQSSELKIKFKYGKHTYNLKVKGMMM